MDRFSELKEIILNSCKSSSIYYNKEWASIKFIPQEGKIFYIEKSRMLDIIEKYIPNYNLRVDENLIFKILDSDARFRYCESHKIEDKYCYTISLIEE